MNHPHVAPFIQVFRELRQDLPKMLGFAMGRLGQKRERQDGASLHVAGPVVFGGAEDLGRLVIGPLQPIKIPPSPPPQLPADLNITEIQSVHGLLQRE